MSKHYELNYIFRLVSSFASYPIHIIFIIIFFLLGFKGESLDLFISFILIYIVGFPIRLMFFRERPKKRNYDNLSSKFVASSFPSLHTARAVYLGIFFSIFFNILLVSIFFIIISIITIYSRIYRQKHHLGDVIGGIGVGILIWFILYLI